MEFVQLVYRAPKQVKFNQDARFSAPNMYNM